MMINDNEFNYNAAPEWNEYYGYHFSKLFPQLSRLNGQSLQTSPLAKRKTNNMASMRFSNYKFQRDLALNFKNHVLKVMSQKIRITFESTTYMMKY